MSNFAFIQNSRIRQDNEVIQQKLANRNCFNGPDLCILIFAAQRSSAKFSKALKLQ